MLQFIRDWLDRDGKLVEFLVIVLGVPLAIFPLWQWLFEREDRRVERIANLVQTIAVCNETWYNHTLREALILDMQKTRNKDLGFEIWDTDQREFHRLCNVVQESARKKAEELGLAVQEQTQEQQSEVNTQSSETEDDD